MSGSVSGDRRRRSFRPRDQGAATLGRMPPAARNSRGRRQPPSAAELNAHVGRETRSAPPDRGRRPRSRPVGARGSIRRPVGVPHRWSAVGRVVGLHESVRPHPVAGVARAGSSGRGVAVAIVVQHRSSRSAPRKSTPRAFGNRAMSPFGPDGVLRKTGSGLADTRGRQAGEDQRERGPPPGTAR